MSSRSLAFNNYAALDDAFVVPVFFFEGNFPDGYLRLHTDLGTIGAYSGVGDLGSIDGIEEGPDLTPYAVTVTLSGINTQILNEAQNQAYYDRTARILFGIRDSATGNMIAEPDELFYGVMSQMTILGPNPSGGQMAVQLTLESEMTLWDRSSTLLYTDNAEQAVYSGDVFFKFLPNLLDAKVMWGDKDATHWYSGGQLIGPNNSPGGTARAIQLWGRHR